MACWKDIIFGILQTFYVDVAAGTSRSIKYCQYVEMLFSFFMWWCRVLFHHATSVCLTWFPNLMSKTTSIFGKLLHHVMLVITSNSLIISLCILKVFYFDMLTLNSSTVESGLFRSGINNIHLRFCSQELSRLSKHLANKNPGNNSSTPSRQLSKSVFCAKKTVGDVQKTFLHDVPQTWIAQSKPNWNYYRRACLCHEICVPRPCKIQVQKLNVILDGLQPWVAFK